MLGSRVAGVRQDRRVVFRVVSWNVRSLRDDSSGVAAFLRGLEADIVLLQ